jgi:CBS domain-containing protein
MANATVSQAMTTTPRSIESSESVVQAARLMASEDVGSLPVVEGDQLVGIVTDRDLVLQVLARDLDPSKVTIAEVASENPVVAKPDEPLDAALQRMAQEQVRRLPVVDGGRLVGILAQADVAREARPASTGEMVEQISQEGGSASSA